jgi:phosphoglycerate dehydrogenase-like enzyme
MDAKPKVAVLDDWQKVACQSADWTPLEARADLHFYETPFADENAAARELAPYAILLVTRERTPFPTSLWTRLPNLRMFGLTGARAGLIDLAGMIAKGITVCYTGGGPSGSSTAEIGLGLMLALARDIPAGDAAVRAGRFQLGTRAGPILDGKTLGLVGLGRLGSRTAHYGNALGMKVIAWSPNLTDERAREANVTRVGKDELMATADVVSLHLVLSERTRGILGAADLARMKPGAMLINTARAPLVEEQALMDAILSGRILAGLDVFYKEPVPNDHPLTRARNVVLTPHLGYGAIETFREYYQQCMENAVAFIDGKPIRVLDKA